MHKCKFCLVYAKAVFQLLGTESSAYREEWVAFIQHEKLEIYFVPPLLSRQVSHHAATFLLHTAFYMKFHKAATFLTDFCGLPYHWHGLLKATSVAATMTAWGIAVESLANPVHICLNFKKAGSRLDTKA